ncbi:MAG: hypothetical protein HC919_09885, partial [Oscillatoriales cyanobacterium SM2_2_1]|nr:hypothetical protein [Oscillatoriales cyanobacterium SM2_2_1]
RPPYSGLFPPADLPSWRTQAATVITRQLPRSDNPVIDQITDSLIRSLRHLPERPDQRAPYEGLFPTANLPQARQQAAQVLGTLIPDITDDIHPLDGHGR